MDYLYRKPKIQMLYTLQLISLVLILIISIIIILYIKYLFIEKFMLYFSIELNELWC